MSELDKLEQYLKENEYKYERIDDKGQYVKDVGLVGSRHQLIVYSDNGERLWDAICHRGSYGYEQGLLEIMGTIVLEQQDEDEVEGFLTAKEIIERIR